MIYGACLSPSPRSGRQRPAGPGRGRRKALLPGDAAQARSRLATFPRRILLAQTLHAAAALICLASTVASVIPLARVQPYFIVSPRLAGRTRQ